MQSVRRIACEGRSPSSIKREAQEATLHGKSVSLNFVVNQDTLHSLERVLSEQKSFGSSVIALNLSDSKLNVDNLVAVSVLFAKSPLQTLVMERCGIDDRAAAILAEFVSKCPKLCTLNVRNNGLSDAGAKLLHKSALGHPCLQSVACDGCPVSVRRQKQLSDIPKKSIAGASVSSFFSGATATVVTPHPTPWKALPDAADGRRATAMPGNGKSKDDSARTPSSSIADSTRLEWSVLTQKQAASSNHVGRSSSVPRFHAPTASAADRKLSFKNSRSITQEAIDAMFSPTPRNVDNRIHVRSHRFKSAGARAVNPSSAPNFTKSDDFGNLLKDQQLTVLQSHCHSLEAELAEQQQILQVEQKRCAAAESQCVQLQHSHQLQTHLISVMRRDLHRALHTVQAVTARCTQLVSDRNLFRDQKRSLEQLIGGFVSGVTSVGSHAPQQLHDAVQSFAVVSQQSSAQEANALEDGNNELMELLRSIWGNADGISLAHGIQPTPAIARVARDFHMANSTPGFFGDLDLQKELLPQFSSHSKTALPGEDSSPVDFDLKITAADSDFDDINRFVNSRLSTVMQQHSNASAAQNDNQSATDSVGTRRDLCEEIAAADAGTDSKDRFELPPTQSTAAHTDTTAHPPATAWKSSVPPQDSTYQKSSLQSYEELQIQLHTGTPNKSLVAAKHISNEGLAASKMESRKEPVLANGEQFKSASLIDPVHDSETHHSIYVQPLFEGRMQSSPHSSTDSLTSMLPIVTISPESHPVAQIMTQRDALAGYAAASNPGSTGISSPKTYEELQVALQRGYSPRSPKTEQKAAGAHPHPGNGSSSSLRSQTQELQQQNSESKSQSNRKASGKSRSKQVMSNTQLANNGGSSSSASSKTPQVAVSTFNLPSSFFS
jgi:hypothetical protein